MQPETVTERAQVPPRRVPELPGNLRCERFRLHLRIESLTILPPYKGGVFRGAFGRAFRKSVCALPKVRCEQCMLRSRCAYATLFEPLAPSGFPDAGKYPHPPAPYVLNPPLNNHEVFRPGQTLDFDLVLMGRAVEALPYFIFSFTEMGRLGLGRERGKFRLGGADLLRNGAAHPVYNGETETLSGLPLEEPFSQHKKNETIETLTLRFLTPLRLKEKGRLVTRLTFPLFFDRLYQRLQLLTAFYGETSHFPNFQELGKTAKRIQVISQDLHWYDWARYSARQKSLMKLGGLRGTIRFEGNLTPFMPYLRAGEMVNVGQGTSFGLGRFEVGE